MDKKIASEENLTPLNKEVSTSKNLPSKHQKIDSHCANCRTPLDTHVKFCHDCGAKVIDHRLTIKHFVNETAASFLNIDTNKPVKTFIHLFKKPEEVIGGYINGIRKRYINAFGYFTIAITLTGLFFFFFNDVYMEAIETVSVQQSQDEFQKEIGKKVNQKIFEYQTVIFFVFIPLLALFSRLVFLKNKNYNYAEHLIINLYAQSHTSIVSVLLYFCTVWFYDIFKITLMLVLPLQILYFCYVLKKLYKLSLIKIILKLLLFIAILIPFFFLLSIVAGIVMVLTGIISPEEAIEAQKAKQNVSYIASSVINWTS
jgi:hypothetical protein